jgi:hypothetical protein
LPTHTHTHTNTGLLIPCLLIPLRLATSDSAVRWPFASFFSKETYVVSKETSIVLKESYLWDLPRQSLQCVCIWCLFCFSSSSRPSERCCCHCMVVSGERFLISVQKVLYRVKETCSCNWVRSELIGVKRVLISVKETCCCNCETESEVT